MFYTLEIEAEVKSVMIGDKIKYNDRYVVIHAINDVDFIHKKIIVRGQETRE